MKILNYYKKGLVCVFMFLAILSSCNSDEKPLFGFPNIEKVNEYLIKTDKHNGINYFDVLNNLHKQYFNSEHSGLMGYNYYSGIILADLDNDGIYELYLNASAGSGIIHNFIHGYNPVTNDYYFLNERGRKEYILFIYDNDVYILEDSLLISGSFTYKGENIKIYKPMIKNNELTKEDIDETLYHKILEVIEFEKILHPHPFNLTRNNNGLYRGNEND